MFLQCFRILTNFIPENTDNIFSHFIPTKQIQNILFTLKTIFDVIYIFNEPNLHPKRWIHVISYYYIFYFLILLIINKVKKTENIVSLNSCSFSVFEFYACPNLPWREGCIWDNLSLWFMTISEGIVMFLKY